MPEDPYRAGQFEKGIRETLNLYPGRAVVLITLIAAAWAAYRFRPVPSTLAYYTTDDGQHVFLHRYAPPPIQVNGKDAVQAMMFICRNSQQKFVGYLLKFTPDGKIAFEAEQALKKRRRMNLSGALVKRPGDKEWINHDQVLLIENRSGSQPPFLTYDDITVVKCPDGKFAVPVGPE